jgi:hypothetical protein
MRGREVIKLSCDDGCPGTASEELTLPVDYSDRFIFHGPLYGFNRDGGARTAPRLNHEETGFPLFDPVRWVEKT